MINLKIFALKTYSTELFETLWKWYSVEIFFLQNGYLGNFLWLFGENLIQFYVALRAILILGSKLFSDNGVIIYYHINFN